MSDVRHERTDRQLARYGGTQEQWDHELVRLGNRCPLCHNLFSSTRLPCWEHDHKTGMWRGIVCTYCNYKLGVDHDDADWYESAAAYLRNPPCAEQQVFVPGSIGEWRRDNDRDG